MTRKLLSLLAAIILLTLGAFLLFGDILVLLHRRPLPDDGFFGLMIGPILIAIALFLLWQALAAFGLVKPIYTRPKP